MVKATTSGGKSSDITDQRLSDGVKNHTDKKQIKDIYEIHLWWLGGRAVD